MSDGEEEAAKRLRVQTGKAASAAVAAATQVHLLIAFN